MSKKWIRLCIKAKRNIHDNLGHKEHSIHSPHPHILFVNLPQILTPPSPIATILHRATTALTDVTKLDARYTIGTYWK
jgi:hypothetical protein